MKPGCRVGQRIHGLKSKTFALLLAILTLVLGPFLGYSYGAEEAAESEVKAAFVYNFIKFVEWPSSTFTTPDSPIIVAILGKDDLVNELEALKGKTAQGRKLILKRSNSMADLESCHVLYVGKSEKDRVAAVLKSAGTWKALSIADMKGFAQAGGMVNFISTGDKVSFEMNPEAAEKAGLKISSKLLKLAKIVGVAAKVKGEPVYTKREAVIIFMFFTEMAITL